MINHIVCQTNLYGNRDENSSNFRVTTKEIRNNLGILSGHHFQAEEKNYWSRQEDLDVIAVTQAMSRNRYHDKKKHLHFADKQNLSKGGKMTKISPLYGMLNRNLVQFGIFHKLLSVDESVVPYFGRHRAKIFIRRKLIRFSFNIWSLCGNDGFPYNFKIYQGKETIKRSEDQPSGTHGINNMVEVITANSTASLHNLTASF